MSRQAKAEAVKESHRIETRVRRRSERLVLKDMTGELNRSGEEEKVVVGEEIDDLLELKTLE